MRKRAALRQAAEARRIAIRFHRELVEVRRQRDAAHAFIALYGPALVADGHCTINALRGAFGLQEVGPL